MIYGNKKINSFFSRVLIVLSRCFCSRKIKLLDADCLVVED